MRTRVKFCGITRIEDAQQAIALGVDALGFVFYPPSQRAIDLGGACAISAQLPPYVARIAVFVSPESSLVQAVVNQLRPNALQFHGDDSEDAFTRYGLPYIKAIGMLDAQVSRRMAQYPDASALLLDTHAAGGAGGSGQVFDWSQVPSLQKPMILAGGLRADNVAQAIQQLRPYALDVASGIESAPGIKSAGQMRAFMQEVARADQN